jgi:hypothetical protein
MKKEPPPQVRRRLQKDIQHLLLCGVEPGKLVILTGSDRLGAADLFHMRVQKEYIQPGLFMVGPTHLRPFIVQVGFSNSETMAI